MGSKSWSLQEDRALKKYRYKKKEGLKQNKFVTTKTNKQEENKNQPRMGVGPSSFKEAHIYEEINNNLREKSNLKRRSVATLDHRLSGEVFLEKPHMKEGGWQDAGKTEGSWKRGWNINSTWQPDRGGGKGDSEVCIGSQSGIERIRDWDAPERGDDWWE